MSRKHSREAFYALDDPLEATVFSVLLELVKEMDKADHDRITMWSHSAERMRDLD